MNARFCSPAVRLLILSLVAVSPGAFCALPTGTVQFITDVYGRNENAGNAALTVTRNGDTNGGCSVNWSVTGGSAVALNDYSPTSGTLNFAAGETFKNISLLIVDDGIVESNETVNLTLSSAVNATISFPSNAVLTIFDNDVSNPPPVTVVQFITDVYGRNENAGDASLTVTRSGNTSNACSVNWSVTGGSATSIADYSPVSGTLNFAAFETFKNISLLIVDDGIVESNETVNLTLSGAVNATIGFPSNAVLTIFDNDVSNSPPASVDIGLGKMANVTSVTNGGYIQFYLYATNFGPNAASNVVIREILPAGLQPAGSALFNAGEHYDSINGYWYITNMPVGYVTTLNVAAQAIANGTHNNVASLNSSQPADSNAGNNSANVSVTVTNPPGGGAVDLGVSKSADPTNQVAGSYVQFTLTVTNYGPGAASNIVVQDIMPPGLPLAGSDAATNTFYDSGSGLWFITNLSAGASVTLGLSAEATTVGSFVNHAEVQSSSPADSHSANNSANATVTIYSRQADVAVTKTVNATSVLVGEPFIFIITVANIGPDLATGVLVNDVLPPGLVLLDLQPSQGNPFYSAGTVTWDAGYLTIGSSASLQLLVAAQSEQTFNNTASVTANEPDPVSTNNTSSASVVAAVAPYIIQNPQSQAEFEGGTVMFTVAAGGSLPLGYQWRFNGADLPGRNGTSITLTGITGANEGLYDVVVTNHAGGAVSDTAYLTVLYRYAVTATAGANGTVSPAGLNIYPAGAAATFTATAGLNHRVDRWFLDGVPVQTGGGTYTLLNIQAAHSVYVSFVTIDPCQGFAVNFAAGADTLAASEIAGVLPQDGWVNAIGPAGTLNLSNGMTVQWTAAETFAMPPLPLSPDFTLMQGGIDSPNATTTVSVSGLSFGSMYDVYVSCAGANGGSGQARVGRYTLNGGTSRFALDPPASPDFDGNYLEATSTTGGAGASNGNYVVFYGVTGTSFNITAQGDFSSGGALRAPINALQIFPRSFTTTSPLSLAISRQTNLPARVHIGGPAGYPVSVESSPDLATWTPVAELMNTNGTVTYDDPDAPGNTQMFYRAVYAGFPSGPDDMTFLGSAPGVAGSSAMLTLHGDVSRPEFAWQSTDSQLGPLNTGFINASNWTLVPGNAACAPRIIFRAIIDCTNFSGSILFGTNGTVTVDVQCIFSNIVRQVR
ncbi:MAG TPA: Calx-beta domain-containing protein, partial [Verrucomicrobiae bacterium]